MVDRYQLILGLIPKLRRFAHAVSGDAGIGDEIVKTSIGDVLKQQFVSRDKENLYRSLLSEVYRGTRVWDGSVTPCSIAAHAGIESSNVTDRLMSLSLPERAALVLATTDTLAYSTIAEIMGIGESAVRGYLTQARGKLSVGRIDHSEPIVEGESPVRATSPQ